MTGNQTLWMLVCLARVPRTFSGHERFGSKGGFNEKAVLHSLLIDFLKLLRANCGVQWHGYYGAAD